MKNTKILIKKTERVRQVNSQRCVAYEYLHKDKDMSIAWVEINGRYPDDGFVMNKQVKEMVYVVKGKGEAVISNTENNINNHIDCRRYNLSKGDALLIQPKQKYYLKGKFSLVIASNPAWKPGQHTKVA